ncbi:MAG TPA: formyltransferase family protein [Candidatus Nanoarchaeia archaeon]|nr:formyltransferase family protein [Candidatus Nanoarchaeia archaeon]
MRKLYTPKKEPMRLAILLSGSGSTASHIIKNHTKNFMVACLFSDNKASKAELIASEFKIPLKINDIKEFYRNKGLQNIKDMKVRQEFDTETKKWLIHNKVDVVALAGYMSLVTSPICDSYITLNSHPADLTIKQHGKRKYTGGHAVLDCVLSGEKEIRTSIIWVNLGCDEGPILVRSKPVKIPNINGMSLEEKKQMADKVQEQLKKEGDYPAYIAALDLLAQGRIEADENNVFIDEVRYPDGIDLAA